MKWPEFTILWDDEPSGGSEPDVDVQEPIGGDEPALEPSLEPERTAPRAVEPATPTSTAEPKPGRFEYSQYMDRVLHPERYQDRPQRDDAPRREFPGGRRDEPGDEPPRPVSIEFDDEDEKFLADDDLWLRDPPRARRELAKRAAAKAEARVAARFEKRFAELQGRMEEGSQASQRQFQDEIAYAVEKASSSYMTNGAKILDKCPYYSGYPEIKDEIDFLLAHQMRNALQDSINLRKPRIVADCMTESNVQRIRSMVIGDWARRNNIDLYATFPPPAQLAGRPVPTTTGSPQPSAVNVRDVAMEEGLTEEEINEAIRAGAISAQEVAQAAKAK